MSQVIYANNGKTIITNGNMITVSGGGTYMLNGTILTGPGGFKSMNVKSPDEAAGIVAGLNGGKKF